MLKCRQKYSTAFESQTYIFKISSVCCLSLQQLHPHCTLIVTHCLQWNLQIPVALWLIDSHFLDTFSNNFSMLEQRRIYSGLVSIGLHLFVLSGNPQDHSQYYCWITWLHSICSSTSSRDWRSFIFSCQL